jgi:hypothetical protein
MAAITMHDTERHIILSDGAQVRRITRTPNSIGHYVVTGLRVQEHATLTAALRAAYRSIADTREMQAANLALADSMLPAI